MPVFRLSDIWKTLLIIIILPLAIGFFSSIMATQFQIKEPKIQYIATVSTFTTDERSYGIYNFLLTNSGNNYADDVIMLVNFGDKLVYQTKLDIDPTIKHTEILSNNSYELDINTLNPKDTVKITLFAQKNTPLPNAPTIQVRGKGVTGTSGINYYYNPLADPVVIGLISFLISIATLLSYFTLKDKKIEIQD